MVQFFFFSEIVWELENELLVIFTHFFKGPGHPKYKFITNESLPQKELCNTIFIC